MTTITVTLPTAGSSAWATPLNTAINSIVTELNAKDTAIAGKANTSHTHATGDVTSGTFAAARLPAATETAIGAVELATTSEATTGTDTTRAVTAAGVKAVADTKAALVHGHALTDANITGIIPIAQVPTGTTSTTVSLGNHTHTASAVTDFNTAADARVTAGKGLYVGINAQTGTTYAPVLTDQGKLVTMTNASAQTVTLPQNTTTAFPIGTQIDFAVLGAGMVTFVAGSGATVNGTPSLITRAQYSAVSLIKISTNGWLAVGDLA